MFGARMHVELARLYAGESSTIVKKAFDQSVTEAFNSQFDKERKVWSAAIFVDIAGFSQKVDGLEPMAVRQFLDGYYKVAIPIIFSHDGKIDRIIGDGIVAIFSSFFNPGRSNERAENAALACAKDIVRALHGRRHAAKASVSSGHLLFCKTGVAKIYEDFTVIGTPLTELYRLEELAKESQILVRGDTELGKRLIANVQKQDMDRGYREVQRQLGKRVTPIPPAKWLVRRTYKRLRGVNSEDEVEILVYRCKGE